MVTNRQNQEKTKKQIKAKISLLDSFLKYLDYQLLKSSDKNRKIIIRQKYDLQVMKNEYILNLENVSFTRCIDTLHKNSKKITAFYYSDKYLFSFSKTVDKRFNRT